MEGILLNKTDYSEVNNSIVMGALQYAASGPLCQWEHLA